MNPVFLFELFKTKKKTKLKVLEQMRRVTFVSIKIQEKFWLMSFTAHILGNFTKRAFYNLQYFSKGFKAIAYEFHSRFL